MKRLAPMLFVLLMGIVLIPALASSTPIMPTTIITAGKPVAYKLEIVADPKSREKGLMHRKALAPHDGMVFLFPTTAPIQFWMRNTVIPLDVLFVDAKGKIVFIGNGKPYSEEPFGPDIPIRTAIEIDGGRAARDGIKVGDEVRYDETILAKQSIR